MKATEFARLALDNSRNWALGLINDMRDAPLTQPTGGGNHPLWVLGHLTHSESQLLDVFILGQENRFPELASSFGMTTQPTTNADDYPPMDDLLARNEAIRTAVLEHRATLNDEDLDKPSHAPEEFGAGFSTVGGIFTAMAIQVGLHAGQVADARRAAGKSPLMA